MKTQTSSRNLYRRYRLKAIIPNAVGTFLKRYFFILGIVAVFWSILDYTIKWYSNFNSFNSSNFLLNGVLCISVIELLFINKKHCLKKALKEKISNRTLKRAIEEIAEKELKKVNGKAEKQKQISQFLNQKEE